MRLLFITTLNLATNPRLVKEIKLALGKNYTVDVVCFEFNNWSVEFNEQLKREMNAASFYEIPAGRKPFLKWAKTVWQEKLYRMAAAAVKLPLALANKGVSRRSDLLIKKINRLTGPYDLVIGHNPAALYPVYYAAEKFKTKAGFDVEDYHPGEGENKREQLLTRYVMNALLPKMNYVSFAAPLIKKKHIEDCGKEAENWFTILNYFPLADFEQSKTVNDADALRLVWFSQNINYKRGLEQIIPVLDHYQGRIELTLIGNVKEAFYTEYLQQRPHIKLMPPQDQKSLHALMKNFDIGLAIEPGKDNNNLIALANKLMTYFQSGLHILASDTPAHIDFFTTFPGNGELASLDKENLPGVLDHLLSEKETIRAGYNKRFSTGQKYNWEAEAYRLSDYWKKITS
jgi:hypothetical protein